MKKGVVFHHSGSLSTLESMLPTVTTKGSPQRRTGRSFASLQMIEEVLKESAEEGYKEGFKRGEFAGFPAGVESGRADALKKQAKESAAAVAALVSEFQAVKDRLEASIAEWFVQSEQAMTEVAMDAVRKILGAELNISRESALAIVKESLAEVTHSQHARIRLNPFDSAILSQHRGEILAAASSLRDVTFVDDPSISGGCVIETDGGIVDSTIETRLILIENSLEDAA